MTNPENLNTPEQTSEKLGVSLPTLARWRTEGNGPAYVKLGHRVAYLDADLASWIVAQRRTFTGQTAEAAA